MSTTTTIRPDLKIQNIIFRLQQLLKNDSDSSSFKKTTPTPAVLKKRLRLQLKTCDSTDSDKDFESHNPARTF